MSVTSLPNFENVSGDSHAVGSSVFLFCSRVFLRRILLTGARVGFCPKRPLPLCHMPVIATFRIADVA